MKRYFTIVFISLFFHTSLVIGQDMHFTQFYASPLYLNPAFTGANVCSRATLVYRNQWPGIKTTYRSYLLSLDHYMTKQHVGIGLQTGVDVAGTGGLKTTIVHPSIAYEVKINKTIMVRAALQPGVTIKSVDFDKLLFGDQIARGGNTGAGSVTTVETPTQSKAFFDIGAGGLIFTANYWLGASFAHLNKPNESLTGAEGVILPIRTSIHGGGKFYLNPDEKDPDLRRSLSLVMHYRSQGEFDQFDVGLYYTLRGVNLGVWYRGLPGIKAYAPGYSNNDATALIIGYQKDRLSIGYSYDITISQLQRLTKGAHELTLSFQLCKFKQKQKRVLVSCPKF